MFFKSFQKGISFFYMETSDFPYLPSGRTIQFVPESNEFMIKASNVARDLSLDPGHRTGCVIVREGMAIGIGANGSRFHKVFGCLRKAFTVKTGTHYWLCPGCRPCHHAEQKAIRNAQEKGMDLFGADVYLWGHWWCCKSCWDALIAVGIDHVYLMEGAKEKFDKD